MKRMALSALGLLALLSTAPSAFSADELHGDAPRVEELLRSIDRLTRSRTPEAARQLAGLLSHPLNAVRLRAVRSLDRMGPVAFDAVLDALNTERNDVTRAWLVAEVLTPSNQDDREMAGDPQVVQTLADLLDNPILWREAFHALSRIATPAALAALQPLLDEGDPYVITETLRIVDRHSIPLVERLLEHGDPRVRRHALYSLHEILDPRSVPLAEKHLEDPSPMVRKTALQELPFLESISLLRQFVDRLPETANFQQEIRSELQWAMAWSPTDEAELALGVLRGLHHAGLIAAFMLAFLLITDRLHPIEPYRFHLLMIFLLSEGFLLSFLLAYPSALFYRNINSVYLLLLLGFLCMRPDRGPGELPSRMGRLGGASLRVLLPPLFFMSAPILCEALRRSVRELPFAACFVALLAIVGCLLIEDLLMPGRVFPRSARARRFMSGALSSGLILLLVTALGRLLARQLAGNDEDGATLTGFLILPLLVYLGVHLYRIEFLHRDPPARRIATPPADRFDVAQEGERITVRVRGRRSWALLLAAPFGLGFPLVAILLLSTREVAQGGTVLFSVVVLYGSLCGIFTWIFLAVVFSRCVIQVQNGYARSAFTLMGASLSSGRWSRRLSPARGFPELTEEERHWLGGLLGSRRAAAPARGGGE